MTDEQLRDRLEHDGTLVALLAIRNGQDDAAIWARAQEIAARQEAELLAQALEGAQFVTDPAQLEAAMADTAPTDTAPIEAAPSDP